MKRLALALAVLASAVVVRADEAASLYSQKCALCHGKDGKGTPTGKKMGSKDLTTLKLSQEQVVNDIANGKGKMPAFKGKITDAQIDALAKYVTGLEKS